MAAAKKKDNAANFFVSLKQNNTEISISLGELNSQMHAMPENFSLIICPFANTVYPKN